MEVNSMNKITVIFADDKGNKTKLVCKNSSNDMWRIKGVGEVPDNTEMLAIMIAETDAVKPFMERPTDIRILKRLLDDVVDLVYPPVPF